MKQNKTNKPRTKSDHWTADRIRSHAKKYGLPSASMRVRGRGGVSTVAISAGGVLFPGCDPRLLKRESFTEKADLNQVKRVAELFGRFEGFEPDSCWSNSVAGVKELIERHLHSYFSCGAVVLAAAQCGFHQIAFPNGTTRLCIPKPLAKVLMPEQPGSARLTQLPVITLVQSLDGTWQNLGATNGASAAAAAV